MTINAVARSVFATFIAVAALAATTSPAFATFPGQNGKIAVSCAFCADRASPYSGIVLFDAAASWSPEALDVSKATSPAWSPDGTALAYTAEASAFSSIRLALGDASLAGIGPSGFCSACGSSEPAFSPDGKRVFFSFVDLLDETANGMFITPTDGGAPVRLTSGGVKWSVLSRASWSPDGSTILHDGDDGITAVNAVTGAQQRLTDGRSPDWSPDGRSFTFSRTVGGNADIYLAVVENCNGLRIKRVRRLTHNPAADTEPSWSPDGRSIAFVSERDGHDELYLMRPHGHRERRLTSAVYDAVWSSWPVMDSVAWQPLPRH